MVDATGASFRSIETFCLLAESPDGSEGACFLGRPRPRLGGGMAAGVRRYAPQFAHTPDMISEATGHRWREQHLSSHPLSLRFSSAELTMRITPVVGGADQPHACLHHL
jgi:hypothetical protein